MKWTIEDELKCLLAFKKLDLQKFPRGLQSKLSQQLSKETNLTAGSISAKICNYKSVAGVNNPSNASKATIELYDKYKNCTIEEIEKNINLTVRQSIDENKMLLSEENKILDLNKINHLDTRNKKINEKKSVKGMQIGQFVQKAFREACKQKLISPTEIINLQNLEYSKCIFASNFEIFRHKNRDIKDNPGYTRYYTKELFCDNYYLTSQWYDRQWDNLLIWLNKIGYRY